MTDPIDPGHFRSVLGRFPTGVTVITASHPDGPVGLAIGSFASVSLEPPLVAFCPGKTSASWPKIEQTGSFCVNVLSADQEDDCRVFASKEPDKFGAVEWSPSPSGSPVLARSLAWIDCTIDTVHEEGDHYIVVGRVVELQHGAGNEPLVFYDGGYGRFDG